MVATNDPFVERYRLPGVPLPQENDDITNKAYVDAAVAGAGGMGDLEFLAEKQLAGDLISVTNRIATVAPATVTSITPANGKTLFISNGEIVTDRNNDATTPESELQNDGTSKQVARGNALIAEIIVQDIQVKGDSLVGDGAKVYRLQKTAGGASAFVTGTIQGWVQDT